MLTNFNIIDLAKKLNINLIAVCSKDELNKVVPKVGSYIINLQDSTKGHGSHWTSFVIHDDNHIHKALYFDSYGIRPPIEAENYIKQITGDVKIPYNTRQIQKIDTSECGWYCLSFLYNLQYKRHSNNMIDDYSNYMSKYSNDLNDELKILKASFLPLYKVDFYNKTIKLLK